MKRTYKSGAQKQCDKKKLAEAARNSRSLSSWLGHQSCHIQSETSEKAARNRDGSTTEEPDWVSSATAEAEQVSSATAEVEQVSSTTAETEQVSSATAEAEPVNEEVSTTATQSTESETVPQKSCNPEALVNLNDSDFPSTIPNPEINRAVIAAGPTQPEGPFPKHPPQTGQWSGHFLLG